MSASRKHRHMVSARSWHQGDVLRYMEQQAAHITPLLQDMICVPFDMVTHGVLPGDA